MGADLNGAFCRPGIQSESCDDGNAVTEDCEYGLESCTVCAADCTNQAGATHVCGDGVTDTSEQCDDGNTVTEECDYGSESCTVCAADCTNQAGATHICGDGVVDPSQGGCNNLFDTALSSGDGFDVDEGFPWPWSFDVSDLGGVTNGVTTLNRAKLIWIEGADFDSTLCGPNDGRTYSPGSVNCQQMSSGVTCLRTAENRYYRFQAYACGEDNEGFVSITIEETGCGGEVCDDGNTVTEDCDYGLESCTVCAADCTNQAGAIHVCGDGVRDETEQCDDSNTVTEDCDYGLESCTVCAADCTNQAGATHVCGDGFVDEGDDPTVRYVWTARQDTRDIIAGNGCQFNPRTSESNYGAGYGECTAGNLGATVAVPTEPPPGNKVWLLKGFASVGGASGASATLSEDGTSLIWAGGEGQCTNDETVSANVTLYECEEVSNALEECDDGNTVTEDCEYGLASCTICAADCTNQGGAIHVCGDGVVDGWKT